jgi:tetratricopeptide (TPR) repeat protein
MQNAECRMQKGTPRAGSALVLHFAFCILHFAFGISPATAQTADPVVVLPFDNPAQEARLAWMREGAAILLTDALAALGAPVIEREERLQAFDRLQLPAHATLSRASTIRVGHALSASSVIVGTLQVQGDRLVARARVVRIDTGRLLPEVDASGPLTDMFAVFATLAQKVRDTPPSTAANDRLAPSPQVFELYVKGLVAETPSTALGFLEQALKAAPKFDRVRLAIWDLQSEASEHQRALDVVSAIAVGSRLYREGRFRAALSQLHLKRFDEALQILRAMQADRPAAPVANAIGVAELRRAATVQPGRATYYFSQASELDPSDGNLFFNLGYAYWLDKDASSAIYWLREAVRRDPADGDAHFVMSVALQVTGATAEATRERELAYRLSSKFKGWEAKAVSGDPVPRGLERLGEELMPARARVESVITSGEARRVSSRCGPARVRARGRSRSYAGAAARTLHFPVLGGGAPAAWPLVLAGRARRRCGGRTENLPVERALGAGPPRPCRSLPANCRSRGSAGRGRSSARARSQVSCRVGIQSQARRWTVVTFFPDLHSCHRHTRTDFTKSS